MGFAWARGAAVVGLVLLATGVSADHYNYSDVDVDVDGREAFGSQTLCSMIDEKLTTWNTTRSNIGTPTDTPLDWHCKARKLPAGHMIELYEGSWAKATGKPPEAPLYANCESFFLSEALDMLLPGENMWSRAARGGLYLFCLLFLFLGVAIVSDVFMNAIEYITSAEKEVKVVSGDGKEEVEMQKVWNDTIANLSLMALGSSAPEILLAVIGVVTAFGEEADALGPGCIVGSASYNLFFITAVCIIAPGERVSKVHQFNVFLTTSFFCIWAYLWLLIIIEFISPERIELWEALVTLLHFPLLLFLAYGADRNWNFSKVQPSSGPDLERQQSVLGALDNGYLKFRRDAIRFISAGRRVMWKGNNGQTRILNQQAVNKKRAKASGPKIITSDPYVVLKIGSVSHKTPWRKKDLNPKWEGQSFTFSSVAATDEMLVQVWDHDDVSRDDFMGEAKIALVQLSPTTPLDTWLVLQSETGVVGGLGELHLKVTVSNSPKGSSVSVDVIEAKNLVGLDKESDAIDALASHVGSATRAMKAKYANQKELWQNMKVDWFYQFKDAIIPSGDKDSDGNDLEPEVGDLLMHVITVFWKVLFAFVPPANYYGGWLAFSVAVLFIGVLTAVVGEIAALFGCVVGLKKAVTAITFVALGTSLPDTFASKAAAQGEKHADAAIGNVTGSNSVNVFLGIGLPWTMAAIVSEANGEPFIARSCGFGLSVFIYVIFAFCTLGILIGRRFMLGGELGGNPAIAKVCVVVLLGFWFIYIIVSSLRYYGSVDDLWDIKGSLASRDVNYKDNNYNPDTYLGKMGYTKDNMNIFKGRDMCSG